MNDSHTLAWGQSSSELLSSEIECQTLINRCLDGDEMAYIALYNQHSGMVYRLAFGLLQNKEDAEDVLQDSFEYAFRKLKNYDPHKSAFTTWLYRITVSRSRNKRRRKWLPTFSFGQLSEQEVPDRSTPSPDKSIELDDRQKRVWEALGALSPKLRETAVLRTYHGLRYSEIGEILSISPKTVESRMRLAYKALREIIDEEELL